MVKIGKIQVDMCVLCTSGEPDDVEHTVLHCSALRTVRTGLPNTGCRYKTIREIVESMLQSEEGWDKGKAFLERIMKRKEELEKERRRHF